MTNSTITDNSTSSQDGFGGGIYSGGTLSVSNSIISGNSSAGEGGGIDGRYGTITVSYSLISGNNGGNKGGGIDVSFDSTISVTNSTISGNTAVEGAGIYNNGYDDGPRGSGIVYGSLAITTSTISNNHAFTGGGIYNNGTLSLSHSTISNNYASDDGGGIYNSSSNGNGSDNQLGVVTVSYSSITGNTAGTAGGGIYNNADDGGDYSHTVTYEQLGIVTVSHSTISGNQAHLGGGIYNDGTLTVGNSIIRLNKAFGIELSSGKFESGKGGGIYNSNSGYATATLDYSTIASNFDTPQEDSTKFIKLDNLVGKFINIGSVVRV
ncbi:hypothetical protein [Nostoc sp.]|uniref:hypothetical protein n=1 Tax=Nostoc sp. TaxID=1180 RepID=UPI002FF158E7